jgi:dipeptidyl aminopeptidase/acylaminoacyl peptidase
MKNLLFLLVAALSVSGIYLLWKHQNTPPVSAGLDLQDEDYAQARSRFASRLLRKGPAPGPSQEITSPPDATIMQYRSGQLHLKSWLTTPKEGKWPAVLFLHGGFALQADHWGMSRPFRDAGFVVMLPSLRGENGQPGEFTMFYDEVEDVLAAADFLAKQPGVDPEHLYISGHSVGGTLTLLAAMSSGRFRAAASMSASPDNLAFANANSQLVPFDHKDLREFQMRSPVAYAGSFKCPVRLYYGSKEWFFHKSNPTAAERGRSRNLDIEAICVPGDHGTSVPPAIQLAIAFFREKGKTE